MRKIFTAALLLVGLSFGALASMPVSANETNSCCRPAASKSKIIGYKTVKVPVYATEKQVAAPAPAAQPCCVAPTPEAKVTEVPVVVHVKPVVVVDAAEIKYSPQPHVQLPPDCPPWLREKLMSRFSGGQKLSVDSPQTQASASWGAKTRTDLQCTGKARGAPFACGDKSPTGFCICP